jgi:hypothetical protein
MKSEISKTETPIARANRRDRSADQRDNRGVWHIILLGLTPLALLAVIGAVILVLVILIRLLIDPARFLLQQQIFTIVMVSGLAVAIIAYTLIITHLLRQIETWRQSGHTTKATAGLVALSLVALIIVLPLILALFWH